MAKIKKKIPKYKSMTAQNDQFSPNNGKAIPFFFSFFNATIAQHPQTPKHGTVKFKRSNNPCDHIFYQAALSTSCRALLTPQKLQKFQFSAHKGILNSLHTPSGSFAFPKSQPGLQWNDKDIFRNSWTLNDREGGGVEEPHVCS